MGLSYCCGHALPGRRMRAALQPLGDEGPRERGPARRTARGIQPRTAPLSEPSRWPRIGLRQPDARKHPIHTVKSPIRMTPNIAITRSGPTGIYTLKGLVGAERPLSITIVEREGEAGNARG